MYRRSRTTRRPRAWMFEGGLALCALAGAVVIADVRCAEPGLLGSCAVASPVPLHREDLLRALPVALAGDRRAHLRADPRHGTRLCRAPRRHDSRSCRLELLSRRAAHPARMAADAPQLATVAMAPAAMAATAVVDPRRDRAPCRGDGYGRPCGEHRRPRSPGREESSAAHPPRAQACRPATRCGSC